MNDHSEIVGAVERYSRDRLAPNMESWEAATEIPEDVMAEMGEMGLFGLLSSEEHGGLNLRFSTYLNVIECIARYAGSISTLLHVHNLGACRVLRDAGSSGHDLMQSEMAAGKRIGSFCLTEPQAGSDTAALKTRAVLDGDCWVLNGTKQFVSNGSIAGMSLVVAQTDPAAGKRGFSLFLVPTETQGWVVARKERKMGQHVADTAQIVLDNCRVPRDALIGAEGGAYSTAMSALSDGRVSIGAQAVGYAQAAFEMAKTYARERTAYGRPIGDHQAVAFSLANMDCQISVARTYVYDVARMIQAGEPCRKEAAIAKLFATRMAEKVCSEAMQVFGGAGYIEETGIARIYRDVKVCQIYEGTNDIMRLVIARQHGARIG